MCSFVWCHMDTINLDEVAFVMAGVKLRNSTHDSVDDNVLPADFVIAAFFVGTCLLLIIREYLVENMPWDWRRHITAVVELNFPARRRDSEDPFCVICLSDIEAEEPCRFTQCGHVFHASCLLHWWASAPRRTLRCPICRRAQRLIRARDVEQQCTEHLLP
mmetsp:Transcript_114495/g.287707  ORF Transcript_114495/g.287707 Transcript_114495/m.287707 type:complete len:161 (-) Transcript_114495:33-515(-)